MVSSTVAVVDAAVFHAISRIIFGFWLPDRSRRDGYRRGHENAGVEDFELNRARRVELVHERPAGFAGVGRRGAGPQESERSAVIVFGIFASGPSGEDQAPPNRKNASRAGRALSNGASASNNTPVEAGAIVPPAIDPYGHRFAPRGH